MKFEKYNANPKGKKTGDCVPRALSKALRISWEDAYRLLLEEAIKSKYSIASKENIVGTLKSKGFSMRKTLKKADNTRYTVKEFIDQLADKDGTYLVLVAKHLTCISNKTLYDTWDCSNKKAGNWWCIYNN